jgi:RND superfamily putative drug exporter
MSRFLHRIGGGAARHPWRVIGLWAVAVAVAFGLAGTVGGSLNDDYTIPGTGTQRATDLLEDRFPAMSGTDSRVVVHSETGEIPAEALSATSERLGTLEGVSSVAPPSFSADGRTAVISVQYDVPVTEFKGDEGLHALEGAAEPLEQAGLQVEYGGQIPENVQAPGGRAEAVGIAVAMVILFFAFGAVVAAGLPLVVALVGLGAGTAGITLMAATTDVSTVTPTLATMVGLGVGIDYALFIVTRHRDGLAAGLAVDEAAAQANATAGQSVVFAGGTVLLAITGLQFCGIPNFAMMGYGTALVVLVAVAAAVTLLPALLGLLKLRVYSRKDRRTGHLEAAASHSPTAARLAAVVGRRPVLWLVASLSVLVALAAPALGMRIGQNDAGTEPTSSTVRQAYDLVAEEFGPGANGPLVVAVDLEALPADGLAGLRDDIAATPGVASAGEPVLSPDGSAAVMTVVPTTGPQDERTTELVERLRADVLPDGADITGVTAALIDLSDVLADNLWIVISVVIATSLLLLLLAFRSLVVPVKAALVNLLSVGAAFGVMTLVFQTETGASLMGLPGEAPISAFVPVLMFAILFGLSMDYEVFLLSRIREEYLRTGQPRTSVVNGLAGTARVISSAALIMVAVFLGFAFDPAVVVKMIGVGMATAIAVDATIVRLILVPAAMALMGRANWYLPAWLDRVLPNIDPHGAEHAPVTSVPAPRPELPAADRASVT